MPAGPELGVEPAAPDWVPAGPAQELCQSWTAPGGWVETAENGAGSEEEESDVDPQDSLLPHLPRRLADRGGAAGLGTDGTETPKEAITRDRYVNYVAQHYFK